MPRLASPLSSLVPWLLMASASGCGGFHTPGPSTLQLSEVMASNDGAHLDEQGEAEDFVELVNVGAEPIDLSDFSLNDSNERGRLPSRSIPPGGVVVLFADDDVEQGELHLDFKLSAGGETLTLVYHGSGGRRRVDEVSWTELLPNEAYGRYGDDDEWVRCTWASPDRVNGPRCGPPEAPPTPPDDVFAAYTWPTPTPTTPLTLSELALSPATFIEVRNTSSAALSLAGYEVRIAPHGPNLPWPGPTDGVGLPLTGTLNPGERTTVTVTAANVAALTLPLFEGVVSVFAPNGTLVDRVDFMRWPVGNALARAETPAGTWRFVTATTPAAANTAPILASRDVGTYVRHLYTPGDFAALARGGTLLDQQAVKFLLDVDVVGGTLGYLMSSDDYPLHFDFVDQLFAGGPVFDRCDAAMNAQHRARWTAFSVAEYYCGETQPPEELSCSDAQRRYMMGTLVHHVGPDLHTLEMVSGDRASPAQMVATFFDGAALSDATPRAGCSARRASRPWTSCAPWRGSCPSWAATRPSWASRSRRSTRVSRSGRSPSFPPASWPRRCWGRAWCWSRTVSPTTSASWGGS
ncbi:MAG: lamin tail domain-containing protein [Sandaracinaceae bacterium]|nr:lamin tail domain-containing protein [Sandaracinaceae bacterium]